MLLPTGNACELHKGEVEEDAEETLKSASKLLLILQFSVTNAGSVKEEETLEVSVPETLEPLHQKT